MSKNNPYKNFNIDLGIILNNFDMRIKALEERIDLLPTKEEFFSSMDRLFTILQRIEQDLATHHSRLSRLEDKALV